MRFPERMLTSSANDFAREILGSADLDQPSSSALSRTAKALGLSVGAIGGWASTAAGAATSAGALSSGAVVATGSLGAFSVLKCGAIGFLLGTVAVAGASGVTSVVESPVRSATSGPVSAALVARAAAPSPTPIGSVPSGREAVPESGPEREQRVPSGTRPLPAGDPSREQPEGIAPGADGTPANPRDKSALAQEVALLDGVRQALRQRDDRAALTELDRYQGTPSDHLLRTEATVLRIEVLFRLGQRAKARQLAAELLAHEPPARLADRLRAMASDAKNP